MFLNAVKSLNPISTSAPNISIWKTSNNPRLTGPSSRLVVCVDPQSLPESSSRPLRPSRLLALMRLVCLDEFHTVRRLVG